MCWCTYSNQHIQFSPRHSGCQNKQIRQQTETTLTWYNTLLDKTRRPQIIIMSTRVTALVGGASIWRLRHCTDVHSLIRTLLLSRWCRWTAPSTALENDRTSAHPVGAPTPNYCIAIARIYINKLVYIVLFSLFFVQHSFKTSIPSLTLNRQRTLTSRKKQKQNQTTQYLMIHLIPG